MNVLNINGIGTKLFVVIARRQRRRGNLTYILRLLRYARNDGFAVTLCLCAFVPLCLAVANATVIRVRVLQDFTSVTLSSDGGLALDEGVAKDKRSLGNTVTISLKNGRIFAGNEPAGQRAVVLPVNEVNRVKINKRNYRGKIIIQRSTNNRLVAINELDMEDYLRGVVPAEASSGWPMEALKSQAVVARTYTLWSIGRHIEDGYDLCNEVHCQVYIGANGETESSDSAVRATKGEVLVFKDKPIAAYYHSNCGGSTENAGNVWGSSTPPYLCGVKCKWGKDAPGYNWKKYVSSGEIIKALKIHGFNVDDLRAIKIDKKSSTGRTEYLALTHGHGRLEIRSSAFRMALGPGIIRSTFFTSVDKKRGGWEFAGRGWGHGIGMCQWGAYGMAKDGYNYIDILKYYYRGTTIETRDQESGVRSQKSE